MKIGDVKPPGLFSFKTAPKEAKEKAAAKASGREVLEPGIPPKVLTYGKPPAVVDHVSIQQLQEESEKSVQTLKKIIVELLSRQGHAVSALQERLELEEQARTEAAALIADDGPLGAEAVSSRIVDFAKALAGGDKTKVAELRQAIEEGFRQAEEILGGLPDVSRRTYNLVMDKLAAWEEGP